MCARAGASEMEHIWEQHFATPTPGPSQMLHVTTQAEMHTSHIEMHTSHIQSTPPKVIATECLAAAQGSQLQAPKMLQAAGS